MYIVSQSLLNMTSDEKESFKQILKSFYKNTLCDNEELEVFVSECQKRKNTKNVSEQLSNISSYIKTHLVKNDASLHSLKMRKMIVKSSNLITVCFIKNPSLLESLKQGGKHNFVYFMELLVAENLTDDKSTKTLLKEQQKETLKSIKQRQILKTKRFAEHTL